jgi:hypothetical protein
MPELTLQERVDLLELEVLALKNLLMNGKHDSYPPKDAWRETIGMFRGDPVFREIMEAGRAIRQADGYEP